MRAHFKRFRTLPVTAVAGLAGALLLATATTGTLSGFAASITNSTNTAASGSLVMQEQNTGGTTVTCLSTDGGSTTTNSSTCTGINKFGGSTAMLPGQTVTSAVTIKNVGSAPAGAFTLAPGSTCTQGTNGSYNGSATDFCSKVNLVITSGATTVFNGSLATFAGSPASAMTMPAAPAAGVSVPFSFAVTLAPSATNAYQGLSASMPITWTFTS